MKQEKYLVQVDKYKNWTEGEYREVTAEELDDILKHYGNKVLNICSDGSQGAMVMWACFKSRINSGCYSDMINAYRLLCDDRQSLVTREHELRHLYNQYEELWQICYYGTVENYYLKQAKEAKEYFERYHKEAKND